ncbi:hypothetical protein, conserved [Eimeria acervulina]|uniref:COPI associated protein n=1 Tax=Eimeria acervulina TaxID=5801 RepID=U6GCA3_EIMAC|nr:hypothetical protein, conserved [Eimeria acervulina]CDI76963.1 hypothetical protein, conserved [Eimeria acervulina]
MESLVDRLPLGVRLFTAASAFILMIGSIASVAAPADYTSCIVCLYLICFSSVCLLCEFSPYGLNVLMGVCPLLGEYFFRGVLYVLVGLLPLGIDTVGLWGGVLLIISGILNILIHALLPVHPYNFYTRRASDPEDEEEGVFNDEPEAEEAGVLR